MRRMLDSKKGFFTDPLVDSLGFIAAIIILIVFSIVFSILQHSGTFEIRGAELDLDCEAQAIQILKMPVELSGIRTDYAGAIQLARYNKTLQERLEPKLQRLFKDMARNAGYDKVEMRIRGYKIMLDEAYDAESLLDTDEDFVITSEQEGSIFFTDSGLVDERLLDDTGSAKIAIPDAGIKAPIVLEFKILRKD